MENATAEHKERIARLHAYFNARDVDRCLSQMTDDVQWPRASEGGEVSGKAEVRAHWLRQWAEFNPHVGPIVITGDGRIFNVTVPRWSRAWAERCYGMAPCTTASRCETAWSAGWW